MVDTIGTLAPLTARLEAGEGGCVRFLYQTLPVAQSLNTVTELERDNIITWKEGQTRVTGAASIGKRAGERCNREKRRADNKNSN